MACADVMDGLCGFSDAESSKTEVEPEVHLLLDLYGSVGHASTYIEGYGWKSEVFDLASNPSQMIIMSTLLFPTFSYFFQFCSTFSYFFTGNH